MKYEQNFEFGSNIILKDISKITSLKIDVIKNILDKIVLTDEISENDLIEKKFFKNIDYIKIKKNCFIKLL